MKTLKACLVILCLLSFRTVGLPQFVGANLFMKVIHGEGKNPTKEYIAWAGMKQRCLNPKNKSYPDYGGRGISIIKRWLFYPNFLLDMGRAPSPLHSLDRINNNKGYSKINCRWATPKEQGNNQRTNLLISYKGETKTLSQWCDYLKLDYVRIQHRITRLEWSAEQAFSGIKHPDSIIRKCSMCGKDKNKTVDFHKHTASRGGYTFRCKDCVSTYMKKRWLLKSELIK